MQTNQDIRVKLTKYGIKATYQRIVIYEALMVLDHPTAEDIFNHIRSNYPSISLATVYKTLETFEISDLVKKLPTDGERHRYDVNTEPHNHLICEKSGKIIDYKDDELKDIILKHLQKKALNNFKVKDIRLQVSGELEQNSEASRSNP